MSTTLTFPGLGRLQRAGSPDRHLRPLHQGLLTLSLILLLPLSAWAADSATPRLEPLPALGALTDQSSVSGLSSGAFMASQFHIAYSKNLVGVGVVAGGPWNCAATNPYALPSINAMTSCMNPLPSIPFPDPDYLTDLANDSAALGVIDNPANIKDDRIYLFSGKSDETVVTAVVDTTAAFYRQMGVAAQQIHYNKSVDAGHAFITDNRADNPCAETEPPYINNCGFEQSQRLLNHIYGALNPPTPQPGGDLIQFDQAEFVDGPQAGMGASAYVYVPQQCYQEACKVHVAFHGCGQSAAEIGTRYVVGTGYNPIADNNGIIVLYPQVAKAQALSLNPKGCWDFWGYTGLNLPPYIYYQQSAPQMQAIDRMIRRLTSVRGAVKQVGFVFP